MPNHFALGGPDGTQGLGREEIVFAVEIDTTGVAMAPAKSAITVSQSSDDIVLYHPLFADSDAVLVGGAYRTTLTVKGFGGCGIDTVGLLLNGVWLGSDTVSIRSPDLAWLPVTGSACSVDIVDLSVFVFHEQIRIQSVHCPHVRDE